MQVRCKLDDQDYIQTKIKTISRPRSIVNTMEINSKHHEDYIQTKIKTILTSTSNLTNIQIKTISRPRSRLYIVQEIPLFRGKINTKYKKPTQFSTKHAYRPGNTSISRQNKYKIQKTDAVQHKTCIQTRKYTCFGYK